MPGWVWNSSKDISLFVRLQIDLVCLLQDMPNTWFDFSIVAQALAKPVDMIEVHIWIPAAIYYP